MKKLFLALALFVAISSTSFAQGWKVGGGLTLGTNASAGGDLGFGINPRGEYSFNELFSIAPGFTYYFPSSVAGLDLSLWQINGDVHYVFLPEDGFSLYGIGGLSYNHWSYKYDEKYWGDDWGIGGRSASTSKIGLNLGAGINFGSMFYGELKYDTAFEQLGISVGVMFSL